MYNCVTFDKPGRHHCIVDSIFITWDGGRAGDRRGVGKEGLPKSSPKYIKLRLYMYIMQAI